MYVRAALGAALLAAAAAALPVVPSASAHTTAPLERRDPEVQGIEFSHPLLGGTRHVLHATVGGSEPGSYLLDWWVQEAPEVGETGLPVELEGGHAEADLDLDVGQLDDGRFHIVVRLREQVDGGGEVSDESEPERFDVDRTAPDVPDASMSTKVIYPANDRYLDSVRLDATVKRARLSFEVADASGTVIRRIPGKYDETRGYWSGETDDGAAVPFGRYVVSVSAQDQAGNVTTARLGVVAVKPGRLATRHTTFRVPAATSMIDSVVGRCAEVRRPASRGWRNSLGYDTAAHCHSSTQRGLALTVHRVRLPRAAKYQWIAIGAFGGAARSAPASRLRLELFRGERDPEGHWLKRGLGQHWERSYRAGEFLFGDRHDVVYWRAYTGAGAVYDVRSFSIRLTYQVIAVG